MKIYIKWCNLTFAQREQVKDLYKDEIKDNGFVTNQYSYRVNPTNGLIVFNKDY